MASRAEEKQARREEREAKAAEAERAERKKKRLQLLGIALGVAAVIVLIAVVISSSGGGKSKTKTDVKGPVVGAATVNKRFAGIKQTGLVLGEPKAPVTLIEFADLQCPFCKQASDNSIPALVDKYVRPGKLRIEFRNFPILGPDSEKAARALQSAADQGKAWQFLDLWYLNQGEENTGYVNDQFIGKIAGAVPGLDAQKVVQASNGQGTPPSVGTAQTQANVFGIDSTPSFLIAKTGQQPQQLQLQDPTNPGLFGQAIDRVLGAKG